MTQFDINNYPNAKKAFEAWLYNSSLNSMGKIATKNGEDWEYEPSWISRYPPSMQYGVLVDWLESEGIYPRIELYPMVSQNENNEPIQYHAVVETKDKWYAIDFCSDRNEARQVVLTAAFDIYEGRNK